MAQSTYNPSNHLYTVTATSSADSNWIGLAPGMRTSAAGSVYVDSAGFEFRFGLTGATDYDPKTDTYTSNAGLSRSALGYSTSDIPDGATITSASISIRTEGGTCAVKLYAYTGDWSTSTSNHTAYGSTLLGQGSTSGPGVFSITLNSDGLAHINKTGSTAFMLRSGYDVDGGTVNVDMIAGSTLYAATLTVNYTSSTTYTNTISSKARIKQSAVEKSISAKTHIESSTSTYTKTISSMAHVESSISTSTKTVSSKSRIKQINISKTATSKARIKKVAVTTTSSSKARVKQTIGGVTLVDSYSESNGNMRYSLKEGDVPGFGQSFRGKGGTLDSCKFYMRRENSAAGNVYARLYAATGLSGSRSPTGSALASAQVLANSLPDFADGLVTFQFDNTQELVKDTYYVITVEYTGGGVVQVWTDMSDPSHPGNGSYQDTGLSQWYYSSGDDFPFYVYASQNTLSAKARIKKAAITNTTSAKAHIESAITPVSKTVSSRGRVLVSSTKLVSSKSRVKQPGLVKTISSQSRIKRTEITKTTSARSRIKSAAATKTIEAKARIKAASVTKTVSSKARTKSSAITKTIAVKTRIEQSSLTKTTSAEARILRVHSETISATANIIPPTRSKTIGAQARILQAVSKALSAKARVNLAVSRVVRVKARVLQTYVKILSTRARVLLPQGHLASAKSRILFSRGYLVHSRSRIKNYTANVVSARARVQVLSSHVLGAKSRVTQFTSHQIDSKANIFNTTTHTVQAKAQIGREGWKYLYARAAIFNVVSRGVSAVARVLVPSVAVVSFQARISVFRTKTLVSRSRILGPRSVTVGAKSRILQGRTKLISARGRVLVNPSKTTFVKTRITNSVMKSVQTRGRISSSNARVIGAKSTLLIRTILVTPITETTQLNPVTFTWKLYPTIGGSKIISEIMVDDTGDTFSSLESYLCSMDGGFEYFNGAEWVEYPTEGVDISYSDYEARVTINLSNGTKYWKARIGNK